MGYKSKYQDFLRDVKNVGTDYSKIYDIYNYYYGNYKPNEGANAGYIYDYSDDYYRQYYYEFGVDFSEALNNSFKDNSLYNNDKKAAYDYIMNNYTPDSRVFDSSSEENYNSQIAAYNSQFLDSDPALYDILLRNPYLDYSDIVRHGIDDVANFFGLRSTYDNQIQQRQQDALKWATEQTDTYFENQQNSELAKVEEMRLAGENPLLLGTSGVTEKVGAESPEPTSVSQIANENANQALSIFSTGISLLGTVGGIVSQGVNLFQSSRLSRAQTENIETQTLALTDDSIMDYYLKTTNYPEMLSTAKAKLAADGVDLSKMSNDEADAALNLVLDEVIKSDISTNKRFSGYSSSSRKRFQNTLNSIIERNGSGYIRGKLADYHGKFMAENRSIASYAADPLYNDDLDTMQGLFGQYLQFVDKVVSNGYKYRADMSQFAADYAAQLNSPLDPNLSREQIAAMSSGAMSAYNQKIAELNSAVANQMYSYTSDFYRSILSFAQDKMNSGGFSDFLVGASVNLLTPLAQQLLQNSNFNFGANIGANWNQSNIDSTSNVNSVTAVVNQE